MRWVPRVCQSMQLSQGRNRRRLRQIRLLFQCSLIRTVRATCDCLHPTGQEIVHLYNAVAPTGYIGSSLSWLVGKVKLFPSCSHQDDLHVPAHPTMYRPLMIVPKTQWKPDGECSECSGYVVMQSYVYTRVHTCGKYLSVLYATCIYIYIYIIALYILYRCVIVI